MAVRILGFTSDGPGPMSVRVGGINDRSVILFDVSLIYLEFTVLGLSAKAVSLRSIMIVCKWGELAD